MVWHRAIGWGSARLNRYDVTLVSEAREQNVQGSACSDNICLGHFSAIYRSFFVSSHGYLA